MTTNLDNIKITVDNYFALREIINDPKITHSAMTALRDLIPLLELVVDLRMSNPVRYPEFTWFSKCQAFEDESDKLAEDAISEPTS